MDRAEFEINEIRGLAERYGGRREPGKLGYVFSPLCWCCPSMDNNTMVRPANEGEPWKCSRGCAPSTEIQPCPAQLPRHHGYR